MSTVDLSALHSYNHEEKDVKSNHCGFILLHFLNWGGSGDHVACGLIGLEELPELVGEITAHDIMYVVEW